MPVPLFAQEFYRPPAYSQHPTPHCPRDEHVPLPHRANLRGRKTPANHQHGRPPDSTLPNGTFLSVGNDPERPDSLLSGNRQHLG